MQRYQAEPVTGVCTFHGEGSFWDAPSGRLLFVDMWAGSVLSWTPGSGTDPVRHDVPSRVAAMVRPRAGGGFVVATERGFVLTDDDLAVTAVLPPVFDDPALRMNEGACHPDGSLYCGSMAWDERTPEVGNLYRLDTSGEVLVALARTSIPNGLVFVDGGATALHVDSTRGTVTRYAVGPDGRFTPLRVHIEVLPDEGAPDGMALDAEGGIWVAMWGGSTVRHYDAAGALVGVVDVASACPTSVAFGGAAARTLFVTTSRHAAGARDPLSGSVFAVEVDVAGADVPGYAG